MQQFSGLAIDSYFARTKRRRARLAMGTCVAATAAALLLGAAPAAARSDPDISVLRVPARSVPGRIAQSQANAAAPEDLTIHLDEGTAVETDDDYAHGITLTNFTGGSVTIDAAGASVITHGTGAIGAVGIAMDGDATVHVGDVRTSGVEAHGIVAGAPYGAVDVKAGSVSTGGDMSVGIRATSFQGPVGISASSVETAGYYAAAVEAKSSGNIIVDVGTVRTSGDLSVGIDAQAGMPPLRDYYTGETTFSAPADLTIHANSVETLGTQSDGVIATNFTMGQTSVEVGSIKTSGDNSWGAYAGGFGDVSLIVGSTETSGANSVGLGAVSFYGNVEVKGDSVLTHGDFSTGVNVINYDLNHATDITVGNVKTEGDFSTGIYMAGAYFEGNEGQAITIKAENVETQGVSSTGVAVLTGGDVTLELGDVVVEGNRSRGVVVTNGVGDVKLTVDSIVTKGESQFGRDTSGLVVANNHGTVDATIGTIETNSHHASAILVNGYDSDQSFTVTGGLTTHGEYSSGFQANLFNGSLTLDAASITTDGAQSRGVYARVLSGDAIVRTGNVATAGDYASGIAIVGASYDGLAHQVSVDAGTIVTQGNHSNGVDVLALGGSADIKIGSVSTSGTYSAAVKGVAVSGFDDFGRPFGGDIIVDAGTVATSGDNSAGIDTVAIGKTQIHVDKVTTEGRDSTGIKAYGYGDITIDAGAVETHGYGSDGINANNNVGGYSGNITITADSVVTTGHSSAGIGASAYYGSTTIKVGSVKTSGDGSDAIYAWSYYGDATVEAGSVTTSGEGGRGITAYSGGTTTVIAGDVTTTGKGTSSEFDAGAIRAVGAAVNVEVGNVSTVGDFSSGIYANSNLVHDNGQVPRDITITAGTVSTQGYGSHGVVAINTARRADVDIDVGGVKTAGDRSVGIYALASTSDISVKAGSVDTGGLDAPGVVAISDYGNIAIEVGSVHTGGKGSPGIYTYAGGGPRAAASTTSIRADAISTDGEDSSGIMAISAGEKASLQIEVGSVSTRGLGSRGIFTYGLGDMTVSADSVSTKGDASTAIEAFSFYGDVAVTAGTVSTEGDISAGVYASTLTGDVSVTVGDVSTAGLLSQGVRAFSGTGDVTVTATGDVSTKGDNAYGILAFGGGTMTIENSGSVRTEGVSAHGLYALGRGDGTTTVINSGSVAVSGEGSSGIRALGAGGDGVKIVSTGTVSATGDQAAGVLGVVPRSGRGGDRDAGAAGAANPGLEIEVAAVTVSGEGSGGILGINYQGDIAIKAGSVKVAGNGTGITAMAMGGVDISVGDVSSGGRGIMAIASDGASLNVTGTVATPNHVAIEMSAYQGPAVLNVAKGAAVIGGGLRNPADDPYTGPGNTIIIGSNMGAVVNNAGTIRNTGDRYTIFVTDAHMYGDLPGTPVGAQINNSGLIEGSLRLTTGDDVIVNSGAFIATRDSQFEAGSDRFVNDGVLKIAPAAATASGRAAGTSVTFTGLESFENGGLIDMRNGTAGDMLTLPGSFAGSGQSTLALDVGADSADRLVVEGAATGSTVIALAIDPRAATLRADPLDVVQVGVGSAADAFKLAKADIGLVRYDMHFDAASGTYSLTSAAGSSVYRFAKLVEGTQAIWNQPAITWSAHSAAMRDADGKGGRLWGQMFGNVVNRDGHAGAVGTDYRQDFFGGQLGYDVAGTESDEGGTAFGVTASYLNSRQRFKGGAEEARFNSVGLGSYARYRSGRFFGNLLVQYAHSRAAVSNALLDENWKDKVGGDSFGLQGEVGVRLGSDNFFAEPVASLAWQSSTLETIEAFGQTLDFDNYKTVTGRIGLRAGGAADLGGGAKGIFYARASYVSQLGGKGGLLFTSGGVSEKVGISGAGDYAEAALGLNIVSEGPVSGFIEGDATLGSGAKGGGGRVGIRFKF